jgi:hypothetical protein
MAEVQLGKLASDHGPNADVRQFGQMMVKDHTQTNAELERATKLSRGPDKDGGSEGSSSECWVSHLSEQAVTAAFLGADRGRLAVVFAGLRVRRRLVIGLDGHDGPVVH